MGHGETSGAVGVLTVVPGPDDGGDPVAGGDRAGPDGRRESGLEARPERVDAANASATPLRTTNNWDQVTKLLAQYGVQAFNGQATAADVLKQVQQQS